VSEPQEAITAFTVWMDVDGIVHAEIGPDIPAFNIRRPATLQDIAGISDLLANEARLEIQRRFVEDDKESTASIVSKALKRRKG
jgi:hypothetical protein